MSVDHITDAPHDETMVDTIVLDSNAEPLPTTDGHDPNDPDLSSMIPSSNNDTLNPKPFVCNVCKNSFSRIDHLARHCRSRKTPSPSLFWMKAEES
jgi:hypothetical protein